MNTVMKRRAGQLWRNLNRSATINFPIKKTLHPELVSEFISKPALLWGSYRSFARRYANLWKGTVSFVMSVRPSVLLRLLLKALQLQGSFGLLNEFFPFWPVSDAVPPVCYFHICHVTFLHHPSVCPHGITQLPLDGFS